MAERDLLNGKKRKALENGQILIMKSSFLAFSWGGTTLERDETVLRAKARTWQETKKA
jgi:hypothetical protein